MKKVILYITAICIGFSLPAEAQCIPGYNFMQVNNANVPSPSSDCVILTPNTTTQKGCAWDLNSTLDFTANFSYDFKINLGANDAGADGMAFVIQNDPAGRCACGTSGGSMGAGGITKSLIIEIDTYLNAEDRDDGMAGVACTGGAEPDHMDMWTNGNLNPVGSGSCGGFGSTPGARYVTAGIPLKDGAANYNIENGDYHLFRVSWDATAKKISAIIMDLAATKTYGTIVSPTLTATTIFGTNNPYFGFTASTGGLSNEQSFCLPAQFSLPVELVSFGALFDNKGEVHVNWTTMNIHNIRNYTLEHSADGIKWEAVAQIPVKNSGTTQQYQVLDTKAHKPVTYYRIRSIDFNNKVDFSYVITANSNNAGYSGIVKNMYPMPANDLLLLTFGDDITSDIPMQAEVYDNLGKVLLTRQFSNATANNTSSLDLSSLSPGFYQVTFSQGETRQVHKISIVK